MLDRTNELLGPERAAGLILVLALHAAALWGLWQHRLLPAPNEIATLFVNFIAPPPPEIKKEPKPPPPPKLKPIEKPLPHPSPVPLVAETPVVAPSDYVAPPPPPPQPAPVVAAPPAPYTPPAQPKPAGPVTLGGELSVACPERTPLRYPPLSRRMGEEGTVVLRVELDEQGQVGAARVSGSSGFARLDEAALAAVRSWRCNPAMRDGRPVQAVALQPFKFVLQGS